MTTAARKRRYLNAMGIAQYVTRDGDSGIGDGATGTVDAGTTTVDNATGTVDVATTTGGNATGTVDTGTTTVDNTTSTVDVATTTVANTTSTVDTAATTVHELSTLEVTVSGCRKCTLCETRRQTVFGIGNPTAECMLVGEAPGAEEDRQGKPFVGRAGQLLDAMLLAAGMSREAVYIANVLKCRPPQNRDPQGEEVKQCEPYLHRQVALVSPKLIVAMGRFAAQSLLRTSEAISRLRGREFTYRDTGIPLIVTYHPAYLLRNPVDKSKSWDDLLLIQKKLASS